MPLPGQRWIAGARPPLHGDITHVSDTALMVAACRALESESSDGLVRDPFALQLAGLRGMEILRALPEPHVMSFGIGVRSRFIGELLLEALASNPIAAVINVGCGLDTRPWRLELTPDLRWIEVDFADVLDYKDAVLSQEKPRCRAFAKATNKDLPQAIHCEHEWRRGHCHRPGTP